MKFSCFLLALSCGVSAAEISDQVFTAIRNNDLDALRRFAENPAARDVRGKNDVTPLLYAASFGSFDAIKILAEAGADVNAKDSRDATPLIYGAWEPTRTRFLLEKGAAVNARSKQGKTALRVALKVPGNGAAAKALLDKGAVADAGALNDAAAYVPEIAKLLIAKGADVNAVDETGRAPLIAAAAAGNLEIVKLLLARSANVNATSSLGGKVRHGEIALKKLTPLMLAVTLRSPVLVKTLLDAGADVNARDVRGMTALMLAVAYEAQNPEIVAALIAKGADPNVRSEVGETALDWARKFSEPAVIRLLEKSGAKSSAHPQSAAEAAPAASSLVALKRSVPLLQSSGTQFFRETGCPACHNVVTTGLTLAPLRAAGIEVDEKSAGDLARSLMASVAPVAPILLQRADIGGLSDTATFVLIGMAAYGCSADSTVDSFVTYVAAFQNPNGSWGVPAMSGVSRAPMEDADTGRTAFAVRALRAYGWAARMPEFEDRIAHARTWLLQSKPETSYGIAEKLLGLKWAGAGKNELAKVATALLAEQRADGGWAQNRNLASDAYATGLAMWALNESGAARASDPSYRRGVDFLLRTQRGDGSWYVRSRSPKFQPYLDGGFPYGHDQWISAAATAYAAIALAPAVDSAVAAVR